MERWLSGRKRLIANPLYDILRTEGSNPSLSENVKSNFIFSFIFSRKTFCIFERIQKENVSNRFHAQKEIEVS